MFNSYSLRISELLKHVQNDAVERLLAAIRNVISENGTIYVVGNGGSATTASHFVNDIRIIAQRRGLTVKAVSLSENIASITAVGNDLSFTEIFKAQIVGILKKEDLLFLISVSGNSANLISAANYAKEVGAGTVALLGFDGGELLKISDCYCLVPSLRNEYGPTEDIHLSICHFIASNA